MSSIKCMNRLGLLAVVVFLGVAACASSDPQRGSRSAPQTVNADALAVAALRAWTLNQDMAQALALLNQASASAPQRPELIWLQARLCSSATGCEVAPLEARLRKLDAKNGIAWLSVLERAQARGDAREIAPILDAMSQAERFDLYWTGFVWRLSEALSASKQSTDPAKPLTAALDDTVEWLSKIAVPAFRPITLECAPERARTAAAIARCERIAAAMQRSDTTLAESLGLGISQRLAQPGSRAAELEQRVETLGYRSRTAGAIMQTQLEPERFSKQLIEVMKKVPREQDVSLAILRWAGQPLTPAP